METTPQIEQHLTANMNLTKKDIMIGNFLGGLSCGIGSVVGAVIVAGIIGYILSTLGAFQSIGNFFNELANLNQQLKSVPKF
jgi:hypothetical protein